MNESIIKKYPYLYDTHIHTFEGSKCAVSSAYDVVCAYKKAGYTGIFITDHFIGGNCRPDKSLDWEQWCSQYFQGWRNAKKAGDELGLDVFLGCESWIDGQEFLIYGITEEWVISHPELKTADFKEQYELVHSVGGIVLRAHPFRKRGYIKKYDDIPLEYIDGIEGINGGHLNPVNAHPPENEDELANPRAIQLAKENGFPITAGSDIHYVTPPDNNTEPPLSISVGMRFEKPLHSVEDYINAVLSHGKANDYILYNGFEYFEKV